MMFTTDKPIPMSRTPAAATSTIPRFIPAAAILHRRGHSTAPSAGSVAFRRDQRLADVAGPVPGPAIREARVPPDHRDYIPTLDEEMGGYRRTVCSSGI